MKKILAVVVAVAMLASLSVSAVATPGTGVIEFTVDDVNTPTTGIHNPGPVGTQGDPVMTMWPSFVTGLHSWNIDFGTRTVPTATGTISWGTNGCTVGTSTAVNDRLGIAAQLMINTTVNPPASFPGATTHSIQVSMTSFAHTTRTIRTLQGFDLVLTRDGTAHSQPASLAGTVATTVTVVPYSATASNTNFGATVNAATGLANGFWGWEYIGAITGNFDGGNISAGVGQAQAEILWTRV